jgi:hypothetical protein
MSPGNLTLGYWPAAVFFLGYVSSSPGVAFGGADSLV